MGMNEGLILTSPERTEGWSGDELRLINHALGLDMDEPPRKITNPTKKDFIEMARRMGTKGFFTGIVAGSIESGEGVYDPIDNLIMVNGFGKYTNMFSDFQVGMLTGESSETSVHEVAHAWMFERASDDLKKKISIAEYEKSGGKFDKKDLESIAVISFLSEGVATYVQHRCNQYLFSEIEKTCDYMNLSVEVLNRAGRILKFGEFASIFDPSVLEEDVALIEKYVNRFKKGSIFERIKNIPIATLFKSELTYRVGYNVVSMEVDRLRESGMGEKEALEWLVANPPKTMDDIRRMLKLS